MNKSVVIAIGAVAAIAVGGTIYGLTGNSDGGRQDAIATTAATTSSVDWTLAIGEKTPVSAPTIVVCAYSTGQSLSATQVHVGGAAGPKTVKILGYITRVAKASTYVGVASYSACADPRSHSTSNRYSVTVVSVTGMTAAGAVIIDLPAGTKIGTPTGSLPTAKDVSITVQWV